MGIDKLYRVSVFPLIYGTSLIMISLIFSHSTIDPVQNLRFLGLSIFCFLTTMAWILYWLNPMAKIQENGIILQKIFIIIGLYTLSVTFSFINSDHLIEGLYDWLKIIIDLWFLMLSCMLLDWSKLNNIKSLMIITSILGFILIALGIIQYFFINVLSLPGNYLIYATMVHKNLFSSAVFLTMPFCLFSLFLFKGRRRCLFVGFILLALFCIGLSKARSVWLAVLIATVVVGVLGNFDLKVRSRQFICGFFSRFLKLSVFAAMVIVILVVGYFVSSEKDAADPSSQSAYHNRSSSGPNPLATPLVNTNTMKERLWLWRNTMKMAADYWILGVGPGNWRIEFPKYAGKQTFRFYEAEQREIIFQRPHNDYIWVLAENGVIGLSLYLSFFATLLFYGFKTMRHAEDSNLKVMAGCMSFGLVGYMVIAFFSFPKERIVHSVLFMLIAACIITGYHKAFPKARKLPHNLLVSLGIIALPMLVFCIFVGGIRLNSEIHTRRALEARQKGDWHTVIAEIDQAESPFYQLDPTAMPLAWYRGMAQFSLGEFERALSDFQSAYKAHPNQIHVLNNLASTYAEIGYYDKAMSFYRQALMLCPDFTVSRDNLALVSLYLEKKKAP